MVATKYRGKWYVDVRVDVPGRGRRRIRRRSPVQTRKGTEAYERQLVEAALSTSTRCDARRFDEYAIEFLTTYAAANNKFSSVVSKESILRVHLIPAFGELELGEIKRAEIERYKAEKLGAGLKAKTVNNHLTVLRRMLGEAVEREYLERVPSFTWLKTATPGFHFLSFEDAGRLTGAADPEWRTMFAFALRTGLRIGELLALQWSDLDLQVGRVLVQRAVALGKVGTPKNGKVREVPLSEETAAMMRRARHLRGPWVFCTADGERLQRSQSKHPLYRAWRRSGLATPDKKVLGWHVLRHTFASHLVMRGVPLKTVQELLGHGTIEMTMRYAHLSPEVKRDAVARLDGVAMVL